ncbi:Uncharacterised protein r2_g3371 [Pycnogonum litorale]
MPTDEVSDANVSATELRLIPEFDGSAAQSVVDWFDRAELVCRLRGLNRLECVIPLRLAGGAFAVYQQLPTADRGDIARIKEALYAAFAPDSFAYEQFISRKLRTGESVDVFLAAIRGLSLPLGGLSEKNSDVCLCCWAPGDRPTHPSGQLANGSIIAFRNCGSGQIHHGR